MTETVCRDCIHYCPHYMKWDNATFREISCGHCYSPKIRHRRPTVPICERFVRKDETLPAIKKPDA